MPFDGARRRRSPRSPTAMSSARTPAAVSFTVEAIVDVPSGPYNRFTVDPRHRTPRLSEVVCDQPPSPANVARLPATGGPELAPMRALVLSRLPLPPGCVVEGRPIAIAEGEEIVLLVPSADAAFGTLQHPAELASEQVYELEDQARRLASSLEICIWLDGDAAAEQIRQRIELAKRATADARGVSRTIPYWRTGEVRAQPAGGREDEPHTVAEYAIPMLPLRFQEYIARMLLPDERILFFVHRPPFHAPRRPPLFRAKKFREGILLVTDRQVLFMEDTIPPGITMVHWGYHATLNAPERIAGVTTSARESASRLSLTFDAGRGHETVAFDFPRQYLPALQEVAALLASFAAPSPRALRRIYRAKLNEAANPPAWARNALDGEALAWAEAPVTGSREGGRVAVSATCLMLWPQGGDASSLSILSITSICLTLSLLGCRLEAICAQNGGLTRAHVDFQYPSADDFVAFLTVVRSTLGNPPIAAGASPRPEAASAMATIPA